MTALTSLDWQPVILLKVMRMPFGGWGGLSIQRAYIALHDGRLLYADWSLAVGVSDAAAVAVAVPSHVALGVTDAVAVDVADAGSVSVLVPSQVALGVTDAVSVGGSVSEGAAVAVASGVSLGGSVGVGRASVGVRDGVSDGSGVAVGKGGVIK